MRSASAGPPRSRKPTEDSESDTRGLFHRKDKKGSRANSEGEHEEGEKKHSWFGRKSHSKPEHEAGRPSAASNKADNRKSETEKKGKTGSGSGGGNGGGGGGEVIIAQVVIKLIIDDDDSDSVRLDRAKVLAYDFAVVGANLRSYAIKATDVASKMDDMLGEFMCEVKHFPDRLDPIGTVRALAEKSSKLIPVFPIITASDKFQGVLYLASNEKSHGKHGSNDKRKRSLKAEGTPKRKGTPGPMARLDDSDINDAGSEFSDAGSDASRPGRKGSKSARPSRNPKPVSSRARSSSVSSKKSGKEQLEVVGKSFKSSDTENDSPHQKSEKKGKSGGSKGHDDFNEDNFSSKPPLAPKSKSPTKKRREDDTADEFDDEPRKSSSSRKSTSKSPSKHKSDDDADDDDHAPSKKGSRASSPSKSSSKGGRPSSPSKGGRSSSKARSHDDDDEYDDGDYPLVSNAAKKGKQRTKTEYEHGYEDDDDERENNGFAVAARESLEDLRPIGGHHGKQPKTMHGDNDSDEEEHEEDDEDADADEEEGGTRDLKAPAKKSAFRTGQRFSANRPWAGAIVAPSNAVPTKNDVPKEELVLEYVHGYRMRDVNNNAFYLASGLIVFPAGAVAVVMDIEKNQQRFFQGRHKEDVTAITVHPSNRLVATGDIVSHNDGAYIYIWDPKAPEDTQRQVQIRVGEKKLAKGVSDLQFSPDGKYLVATGMDDDHLVYLYDWQKAGKLVAKEKGHTDSIFGIEFNPKVAYEFVTFGVKHLKHWTFDSGSGKMKGERGLFGQRKVQSIICCAFLPNGNYVTGTHGGELLFWSKNQVMNAIENVHNGPVFSVRFDPDLGLVTAGAKDGLIVMHDPRSMEALDSIQMENGVRSVSISSEGKLLVGLADSLLLEISGFGQGKTKARRILEAHSAINSEELWGCAINPRDTSEFVTAGDDSMVMKRSVKSRATLESARLQGKLRAIDYSPDGKCLAVGNDHGDLFMLKASDLAQQHYQKYEKPKGINTKIHAVEVLRFSPCGRYLAVGTHDCVVYVWQLSPFKQVGICKGHSSFITHLDWSSDSAFIQTNSGDFELLFWTVPTCKQVTSASSVKDVKWATFSCVLGWPVQGIWEKGMEGNDINCVDRSPTNTCLASGTDFLTVKLHNYPASKEQMPFKMYYGHGSHVTKVVFTCDGSRLITTGGLDGCTFQWRVEGGSKGGGGGGRRRDDDSDDDDRRGGDSGRGRRHVDSGDDSDGR